MMQTDFECLDGAVECSTLTSEEAAGVLRYAGVRMSIPIFQNGIAQGVFPFAFSIDSGKRNFVISKHKLEIWLKEFTGIEVSVDKVLEDVKHI